MIFQDSLSSTLDNTNEINNENKEFIDIYDSFCDESLKSQEKIGKSLKSKFLGCHNNLTLDIPKIVFIGNILQILCSCGVNLKLTIDEVYEKYVHDYEDNSLVEKYYKCQLHKKKWRYYCFECKKNLCSKCCKQCKHNNKSLFVFDKEIVKTEEYAKKIKKKLNNNKNINDKLKDLLEIIIDNFNKTKNKYDNSYDYYHYSHFNNLGTIYKYLEDLEIK